MKRLRLINVILLLFLFHATIACTQQETPEPAAKPASLQASKEQISEYVRKALNVPKEISITVTDSDQTISGLKGYQIHFKGERVNQVNQAWLSPDNKLIMGKSFDLSMDPYKERWERIDLANVPTKGAAEAKVTIVEYSDYQCPFCSRAHGTVNEVLNLYQGKVKIVYKHLPLTSIHDWAEEAAIASACVQQQNNDAFWKLTDQLFANQKSITKETLKSKVLEYVKDSGVNEAQLQQCIDSRSTLPIVQANTKEAGDLGFTSTPSFVINGRSIVGARGIEQFKAAIDEALAETK